MFGLIFIAFIPITNLIQVNLADAAPLALPPETQYAGTDTGTTGDDRVTGTFNIGFNFSFFGNTYSQFQATTNGLLCFNGEAASTYTNSTIPSSSGPNNCIYAFWDDLMSYGENQPILYRTIGEVGSRMLIVQWTNYGYFNSSLPMGTFQAILYEGSNNIRTQYRQLLTAERSYGQSATIGLESSGGASAVMYSYNTASLDPEQSIIWTPNGSSYTYNDGALYEGVYLYKDNPPPNVPELVSPSNGSAGVTTTPTFTWNAADGATIYNLVVSTNSSLSSPVINQTGLTTTSYTGSGLSTGPTYYWGVEAINAYGNSWSSIWNFTTAAGNSAPSDISLSNTSISQGLPSGTTVGTLSTTDPDEEDTHLYSLVTGGGSADNESFTISGSTLMTAESLSQGDYTIRVRSSDGQAYVEEVFTISVTEVNVTPTDIALSHYSFSENLPAGTEIATLSTTDANASDTFMYSFVSGTGDSDNSSFTLTGSSLTINAIPDYETQTSYSILVRSTDSGGLHVDKQFTIIVTDLDDDTIITVLSDTPDPTVVGEPYTVSISVAPAYGAGTPTGEFDVSDGTHSCTGTLSAGTGSCSLTSSTSGSKTLNITYVGVLGWNLSTTTTPHTVNQADTTTTITSINSEPSELGSEYTVHFSVIPNAPSTATVASGTVVVTAGTSYNDHVPITNGTGSVAFDGNATGTFPITINYPGESGKFTASSTSGAHVVEDTTPPDVIITYPFSQDDPTNTSPIIFSVFFEEAVTGFDSSDIDFTGSTAPGTLAAAISGSADTYQISVSGMTDSGLVVITIPANSAVDPAGNGNLASTNNDNAIHYDITPPAVTINQAASQADPTASGPITFDVEFSESVTGFSTDDVDLSSSTTPGTLSAAVSGSGTTYYVSVSGMTDSGIVVVSIPADATEDEASNLSEPSTSTDNSVTYDVTKPTVTINRGASQDDPVGAGPIIFDVVFSEPVTGFSGADVDLSSSTAPGTLSAAVSGSGTTYEISVSGMTDTGLVIATLPADSAEDAANNTSEASTSTDNSVTYDVTDPTVTVNQASVQLDPTRLSPILFEVEFSESVTGFDNSDIDFTGTTAPGALAAIVSGSGTSYQVSVNGMTDSGDVIISVPANSAVDAANNSNEMSTSTDNTVTYDVTPPTVTVNQGASQADPTNTEPIVFDVVFSEDVIGFDIVDLIVVGMANSPTLNITGSGAEYEVEVSGVLDGETVTVEILEMAAVDASGNENLASTSTDNNVSYDITCIEVMEAGILGFPGNSVIQQSGKYINRFNEIVIEYDSDAYDPPGDTEEDDVTNPENYYLIGPGENKQFDITTCAEAHARSLDLEQEEITARATEGPVVDDLLIPMGPVTYDNHEGEGPFEATLVINGGQKLSLGKYRMLICGSTTIMDLAMNPLNDGEDISLDFTIEELPEELPMTGFAPGRLTELPLRIVPDINPSAGMVLSLPKLGISAQIIGVPLERDGWNTTWLGNYAGYLEGSAFPTWDGNTVITGHVWTATNSPGIFLDLNSMKYGDEIKIYAWGQVYTYVVRSNFLVSETNVAAVMQSETSDTLTLMTCDGYDPDSDAYIYRRVVRAVLVTVE